uniref:Mab-21 domain-containing protein n=1 Tax=Strongyloides papillosus TaxID=174720 RepID=A0A0N5BS73_STREA
MVKKRSKSAPKSLPITGKDRRVITKSEEFDEIVRKARRDAKKESTVKADDADPGNNMPPIEEYDESIGRMATDDEEKTLRHVVRNMGECFENTMILNNSIDDDQYMMTKKVDARKLVKGIGYQYNCFIEEDMKRYSIPPCEKKPVDLHAKKESTVKADDADPGNNMPPIEEYDESIGRMATDDEEKTLRHVVRNMGECFENTMILNNSIDDDQYMMTKKVDARKLVKGIGYQYNCFIEEDMKRYSIPPCEKKPVDLLNKYGINLCTKSDNGSIVDNDKGYGSPNQQRCLMNVRQSKFGRDYPNISKSERVRRNTRMSQYKSSENESYRRFEEMRQYPVYPQYGSYRHMPMMPVYNSNVKIDAYDPKESFTLFYERFESMLLLNKVPSHLKLPMLKLHLKGRVANDVQTQREIKNDYKRLVDYLKRNYTCEESIAAARHKLSF